jgi:hypothetical protein
MFLSDKSVLMMLDQPCDVAVDWLTAQARQAGVSVLRTFDLQIARQAQTSCPCPHHGTEQCDCQLIILLVYQNQSEPLAIVAHGYEGQTWFSIVDTPQQRADPNLQMVMRSLLSFISEPEINRIEQNHPGYDAGCI